MNGNYFLMKKGQLTWYKRYISELSPEGEVNIAVYIPRRGCFSVYQISLIKIKTKLFVNKGRHLVGVCLRFN